MKKRGTVSVILSILILAASLFLMVGVRKIFPACEQKPTNPMDCVWTERAESLIGLILTAESLVALFPGEGRTRFYLSLSMLTTAVIGLITPGYLFPLCKMTDMRCRLVMRTSASAVLVLICLMLVLQAGLGFREAVRKKNESPVDGRAEKDSIRK